MLSRRRILGSLSLVLPSLSSVLRSPLCCKIHTDVSKHEDFSHSATRLAQILLIGPIALSTSKYGSLSQNRTFLNQQASYVRTVSGSILHCFDALASAGISSHIISVVGSDKEGLDCVQILGDRGVSTEHIIVRPGGRTTTETHYYDAASNNQVFTAKDNALLHEGDEVTKLIARRASALQPSFAIIDPALFTNKQLNSALKLLRDMGSRVALEASSLSNWTSKEFLESISRADVLALSFDAVNIIVKKIDERATVSPTCQKSLLKLQRIKEFKNLTIVIYGDPPKNEPLEAYILYPEASSTEAVQLMHDNFGDVDAGLSLLTHVVATQFWNRCKTTNTNSCLEAKPKPGVDITNIPSISESTENLLEIYQSMQRDLEALESVMLKMASLPTATEAIARLVGILSKSIPEPSANEGKCEADFRHIWVTGVGKSFIVANRFSAALRSVGARSSAVHGNDFLHGDVGAVRPQDVIVAFTHSGSTPELEVALKYLRERTEGIYLITGSGDGTVSQTFPKSSVIEVPADDSSLGDIPSRSVVVQEAVVNGLITAVICKRGLKPAAFHRNHPGGAIGFTRFSR